jgi:hypothetical protein
MTDAEQAWVVLEYAIRRRRQVDICDEIGHNSSRVSLAILTFTHEYAHVDCERYMFYGETRRDYATIALNNFYKTGGRPARPGPQPPPPQKDPLWRARWEHAFLLRCEGLTYRTIGERLGVSHERARGMVFRFSNIFNRRTRHARLRFIREDAA